MKSYSTNKTIFNHIHEIRSFGLTDFSDNKLSNNKGFTYIFVIKVKFSNELWAIPLKIKNSQTITEEISNILRT